MQKITFLVQGSSEDPYEVVFQNDNSVISATCTCQAGVMWQVCKHRMSILGGSSGGIVSGNDAEMSVINSWLPGSKLALAISALSDAESDLEKAKKRVSALKKQLALAMHP